VEVNALHFACENGIPEVVELLLAPKEENGGGKKNKFFHFICI
jgi:hypothetical protein